MRKIPSKQQILLKLAPKYDCDWDNLLKAWNALYQFLKSRVQSEDLDIQDTHLETLWKEKDFPLEQMSMLGLHRDQEYIMIRSVCCYITNKAFDENQFEISSPTANRPDPERDETRALKSSMSKQECLSRLAQSQDRKWNNLHRAWDALEQFIEPRLERRKSKLPSDNRLEKWRMKPNYPFEQILALNLSKREVNMFMRSVCFDIAGIKPESDQGPLETPRSTKRSRDDDGPDDDVGMVTAPKPNIKRLKHRKGQVRLPVTTKIYFMQEGEEETRTGIPITLLSNAKAENDRIELNTLRYGNATRHLAKRSNFEKDRHQLFYYDPENHHVRINVDTVASFRAAVEEMFTYRKSEPQIEFCFRVKESFPA